MTKCREQCDALLAQGRQVTANTAEHRHSLFGAEAPGDLLLHFDPAQISLGLVVVKRHGKIDQEAQHGPSALREPIQQIARRTLFRSPRFSLPLFRLLGWWRWRIGEVAFGKDLIVATQEACQHQGIQFVLAQGLGSLHLGFHLQQQLFHLARPGLLEFFLNKGQLPQMMHIAPRLNEAVALIAQQAIMDARATKRRSNANGIECLASSARMSGIVGKSIRRADVDPPALFANAQSRFILVDHLRPHQSRFEVGFHLGQLFMTGFDKAGDAACRELDSQELLQQLAGTSVGYHLAFHQVGRQCLDARSILRSCLHRSWKVGSCQMKAPGTLLFFHTVLGDPELFGWQVHHLTPLWHGGFLLTQIVLAALTAFNGMNEDVLRLLHLLEMMPTVSDLSARLLPAFFPQALGWPHKAIRGRRQVTIMADVGLLSFPGVDALLQKVDQPFKGFNALLLRVNGDDGLFEPFAQVSIRLLQLFEFFIFASQPFAQDSFLGPKLFEFFILRHAPTVANSAMLLQLHDPPEWLPLDRRIAICYMMYNI